MERIKALLRRKPIRIGVYVLAGLILIGIGAAAGAGDETEDLSGRVEELEADLAAAEVDAAAAREEAEEARADADQAEDDAREQVAGERERMTAELDERAAELDAREADLVAREAAVSATEAAISANQVGDGVWEVGRDIEPGTYRTSGVTDCYWAILADPNGSDIIENNIVSGNAVVRLSAGQFFESTRCGTWQRDL